MSGAAPQADHSPDPVERPAAGHGGIWHRIREHRIIQWALGYLAAALALTHAEELVAHAFGWPELVGQLLIVLVALGLPVAITLAWYHGHHASRHVSGAEATIIAVLLLLGAGFLWLFVRPHEPSAAALVRASSLTSAALPTTASVALPSEHSATSGKVRLAVLPFDNLSPDPANAFFADGLHEEILSALAQRAPSLEVISRTSVMIYRQKPKSVADIANELRATHVLEGSVRRVGTEVRVTLQLIDARTDDHVWAHNYDRTLANAITLESDVANQVAQQLTSELAAPGKEFAPPTRNPEAYDLYLRAVAATHDAFSVGAPTLETLRPIFELLDRAIQLDPSFAQAYAFRGIQRMLPFIFNIDVSEAVLQRSREDIETAERLAPRIPMTLEARATYLYYVEEDLKGALAAYQAADALRAPSSADLQQESNRSFADGDIDAAIQESEHAMALDPKNPFTVGQLGLGLSMVRRPADSLRQYDFAIAEFPAVASFRVARASTLWGFTGDISALNSTMTRYGAQLRTSTDLASFLRYELVRLRVQHRYREIADLLARVPEKTLASPVSGAGQTPLAEPRGWARLLLGDRVGAAEEGRMLLEATAHQKETMWNRAWLHVLAAEGHAFRGERTQAIAAAREALGLVKSIDDKSAIPPVIAAVFAWTGAEDDAVDLLERLSTEMPMVLYPAAIARDPLYGVPLAANVRYQALKAKLESQMATAKLE